MDVQEPFDCCLTLTSKATPHIFPAKQYFLLLCHVLLDIQLDHEAGDSSRYWAVAGHLPLWRSLYLRSLL